MPSKETLQIAWEMFITHMAVFYQWQRTDRLWIDLGGEG